MIFSPAPLATPPPLANASHDPFSVAVQATPTPSSSSLAPSTVSEDSDQSMSATPEHRSPVIADSVIRAISPPTPAPSPRPEEHQTQRHLLHAFTHSDGTLTPSDSPDRHGDPPTPLTPSLEYGFGAADGGPFAERYIDSVVAHFPRLSLPERRKLFSSLLPFLAGEDMLHLSQLITPFLRRDFISELPAEIALHILAFIDDPKDLVRASRVSRTWRALVSDEQTWKMMLEKYRGRGAGAASMRPPLERIRMQHPQATFGPIANSPSRAHRPGSLAFGSSNASLSSLNSASSHSRGVSVLSATAQPFQFGQSGLHMQSSSSSSIASTSSATLQSVVSEPEYAGMSSASFDTVRSEGENVNRFLDENTTPLADRKRRSNGSKANGKGKSRAVSQDVQNVGAEPSALHGQASSSSSNIGNVAPLSSGVLPDGHPYWQMRGLGFSARRASPASPTTMRSPNAPPPRPLQIPYIGTSAVPPPQDLLTGQMSHLSVAGSSAQEPGSASSSIVSPGATFAPAYNSPAPPISYELPPVSSRDPMHMSTPLRATEHAGHHRRIPQSLPSDLPSQTGLASRQSIAIEPIQSPVAVDPPKSRKRFVSRRSMNPFGASYTSHSNATGVANQPSSGPTSQSTFSYKAQFKRAYLTESNWLRGPGRLLSRQTSIDDGVVTSLGFDNEWIIIGMANKQIHVFDARTGEYVRELIGHTSGVWALVLITKGGERTDEHGRKIHPARREGSGGTTWDSDNDASTTDVSGRETESSAEEAVSPTSSMPWRSRSASARPPESDRFFTQASSGSSPVQAQSSQTPSLSASAGVSSGIGRTQSSPFVTPSSRAGNDSATSGNSPGIARSTAAKLRRTRRPSSFCGLSSLEAESRAHQPASSGPSRTGFPFGGDEGGISPQQAAACGTASGWGQAGAIAVTGGCDRDVRVWDVTTGRCLHVLRGHMSTVRCLKVLDGRPVAISGSRDATLRVWDIERGVQLRVLVGHQHSVRCIEISGNKLVSGSYDTTCRVWDADTGECLHLLQGHQHQIYAVAFDGQRVASGSLDSTVRIWSAKTGECLALLQGHTSLVGQLQLTDSVLVTGGSDGRVIVFSLSTFECLHRLCAHDNSVTCLQFNERFMVTGGNDGRVKLWDRPSGKLIRELAEPCEAVWRVTFREDKCVLLCKRNGRTVMEVRTFAPTEDEV